MKKSFVFAFAMVMAVAASANTVTKKAKSPKVTTYTATEAVYDVNGNANVVEVNEFDVAQIDVPARVRVVKGDTYGVNLVALDKKAEKSVRYNVKNGVIRFYSNAAEELENGTVVINLVVPSTPEIRTAGSLSKYSVR